MESPTATKLTTVEVPKRRKDGTFVFSELKTTDELIATLDHYYKYPDLLPVKPRHHTDYRDPYSGKICVNNPAFTFAIPQTEFHHILNNNFPKLRNFQGGLSPFICFHYSLTMPKTKSKTKAGTKAKTPPTDTEASSSAVAPGAATVRQQHHALAQVFSLKLYTLLSPRIAELNAIPGVLYKQPLPVDLLANTRIPAANGDETIGYRVLFGLGTSTTTSPAIVFLFNEEQEHVANTKIAQLMATYPINTVVRIKAASCFQDQKQDSKNANGIASRSTIQVWKFDREAHKAVPVHNPETLLQPHGALRLWAEDFLSVQDEGLSESHHSRPYPTQQRYEDPDIRIPYSSILDALLTSDSGWTPPHHSPPRREQKYVGRGRGGGGRGGGPATTTRLASLSDKMTNRNKNRNQRASFATFVKRTTALGSGGGGGGAHRAAALVARLGYGLGRWLRK